MAQQEGKAKKLVSLDCKAKEEDLLLIQTLRLLLSHPHTLVLLLLQARPTPVLPPLVSEGRETGNRTRLPLSYLPGYSIWPGSYPNSGGAKSLKAGPHWRCDC